MACWEKSGQTIKSDKTKRQLTEQQKQNVLKMTGLPAATSKQTCLICSESMVLIGRGYYAKEPLQSVALSAVNERLSFQM